MKTKMDAFIERAAEREEGVRGKSLWDNRFWEFSRRYWWLFALVAVAGRIVLTLVRGDG